MENTWYTVISPESCSSILWRSWEFKEQAASALKLTATDLKKMKLIDKIIKEPFGGAHKDREKTFKIVEKEISKTYAELSKFSKADLVKNRMDKYAQMGVYKG
jgi:acetyl-CoA carboxylase carboxyl transferase subunit alpha